MSDPIRLIVPIVGTLTQRFGENPQTYARWGYPGHNGVDWGAVTGTEVRAAHDGVVSKVAYEVGGYGRYMVVMHSGGWMTYYAHLDRVANTNGNVKQGDVIAYSDNTGWSSGPHLHFSLRVPSDHALYEARWKGYTDPMPHFQAVQPPDDGDAVGDLDLIVIASPFLNVRSGPGVDFPTVGRLAQGDRVSGAEIVSAWVRIAPGEYAAMAYNGQKLMEIDD